MTERTNECFAILKAAYEWKNENFELIYTGQVIINESESESDDDDSLSSNDNIENNIQDNTNNIVQLNSNNSLPEANTNQDTMP